MKRFSLSKVERDTLLEMGVRHTHARVRRRAQALLLLEKGRTQGQVAEEFGVHLNSVKGWKRRWDEQGLVGLSEGRHPGRPSHLSPAVAQRLRQVAEEEGGTAQHIMQCMEQQHMPLQVRPSTVSVWLKNLGFTYKRYRTSLKKSAMTKSWRDSGRSSKH